MRRGAFAFTKWYIDCLDREGRLVILYWASLEWRRLRLTWHSVSSCEPGARVTSRSSVVACASPVVSATAVSWKSTRLDCEATLDIGVCGIAEQQLAPGVSWTCVAPAARATIRLGDTVVRGTGYAEVIVLTTPPWKIGIEELRWGRWISDDASRSMVWIAWKHGARHPERSEGSPQDDRSWVFLDGALARSGDATLALDAPVVVMDRGLSRTIGKVPGLRAVSPRWLLGGREQRRTHAGTLRDGAREVRGTAVDEIVEFG